MKLKTNFVTLKSNKPISPQLIAPIIISSKEILSIKLNLYIHMYLPLNKIMYLLIDYIRFSNKIEPDYICKNYEQIYLILYIIYDII